jgi:hypothetical protein
MEQRRPRDQDPDEQHTGSYCAAPIRSLLWSVINGIAHSVPFTHPRNGETWPPSLNVSSWRTRRDVDGSLLGLTRCHAIDPKALVTVTRTRLAGTYLRIVVDVRPVL